MEEKDRRCVVCEKSRHVVERKLEKKRDEDEKEPLGGDVEEGLKGGEQDNCSYYLAWEHLRHNTRH